MQRPGAEGHAVSGVRCALEALAVSLVCGAFLWPWRLYGFDLVDEGTQLVQISRVAAGERPYLDFETGYTPGYFTFAAWLLDWGGGSIVALRTFAVVLQSALVGALWAIVRTLGGARLALGTVVLYVAFLLPFSLRSGAPFTIPYPGWMAAPLALGAQFGVAMLARGGVRGVRWLCVGCGVLAGLAFAVKPNSGLLIVAAVALALVPGWNSTRSGDRRAGVALGVGAVCGTALLLMGGLSHGFALPLFAPVVVAAWCMRPQAGSGVPGLAQLGWLGLGFVLAVAPWLLPLLVALGPLGVARDVLLLDGSVIEAYLLPFAAPSLSTLALALGMAAACIFVERPKLLVAIAAATLGAMLLGAYPDGALFASENVLLWLGPLTVVGGLVARRPLLLSSSDVAVLGFVSIYSLQLFPRPDPIHVAMGGAPLAYATALVWARFAARWRAGAGDGLRWVSPAILAVVLLLAVVRVAPAAFPRWRQPVVPLDLGSRAPVVVLERHAGDYDWATRVLREVRRRTSLADPVFFFPDVAGLGFLAPRPQPFYYLYFVPGRPGPQGERRTIERLEEQAPALVVACRPRVEAFSESVGYYSRLGEYFDRAYAPATEIDGCRVLSRRLD